MLSAMVRRTMKSPSLKLVRVCQGLYMDHKLGITLDHESTWSAEVGRKWVASWSMESAPGVRPHKVSRKFDTAKEARDFLKDLIKRQQ